MNLNKYKNVKRRIGKDWINLNPIQRGGVLPPESRETLQSFGDGYSTCDYCLEGRVDLVDSPPIDDLAGDIAKFVNMDEIMFTAGCRHVQWVALKALTEPGDVIVIDSLAHYTTYLAAENLDLEIREVPHNGYPDFELEVEDYADIIEEVEEKKGETPAVLFLTHVDYRYGNRINPEKVGKIAKKWKIPYFVNAAYTGGIMPIDGRRWKSDFIGFSGHKSWASSGPIGMLATSYEHSEKTFPKSEVKGPWSGRGFTKKIPQLFGCPPVFGAPIATLMSSFPHVYERVQNWDEHLENARWFVDKLEKIEDFRQIGQRPRKHTLMSIETPSFHRVSKRHERRGFFLYDELKERKIAGIQPGLTKMIKINTYGLSKEELEHVISSFYEIAEKYDVEVG
ncbi:cysteine--tRNA ligase [candidate division MSBL1 archaeon SCGC-AAA259E22]|uniref:O-phospho-L-seryl-tRNA:Cys-tRNA synthase n=1 Tax=candidate division MSBL1 archaeon SCGC-AAA259E22 TaxID=1698265 RepID=A0A133UIE9_9EURY|nr:cysteine--tRNA ligase [candidate division MSBL1 archaeon SCGC-AAA259E22]